MYDLRIVVDEVKGFCDMPMKVGDFFEVRGGRIIVPPGQHICMWALQSLMPFFPVKQRASKEENDWIPYTKRISCPDPNGMVIYRIDRIKSCRVLDEHFSVPYKDRFQEGEFRKRVQFMYGGKLERIRFRYTGPSIEAVLDRLPTAEIVEQTEDGWIVEAEVFGKGIKMWLRSQGEYIEQ